MTLRVFPVVGEALNFGGRRMETIVRVAWLPVTLLLIVNMTTVFAYLSVIAGRAITFADIPTFLGAQQALSQYAWQGWTRQPVAMWSITGANLAAQTVLIASFMAPLIRYAGLGERPGPGVVKLAFGPDQIRYILSGLFSFLFVAVLIFSPIATATFYVLKYIGEALSQTMVSFPDPDSLHTIELKTAAETIAERGVAWVYYLALPLAAAAPFALAMWALLYLHFHPRNRPSAPAVGNPFFRAVVTLFITVAVLGGALYLLGEGAAQTFGMQGLFSEGDLSAGPVAAVLLLSVIAYLLVGYFNLRLYPYPGVAVCRKSMGLAETLKVSRGWNLIRLQIILILVGAFLITVQHVVNTYALTWVSQTLSVLYQATATSSRLLNSGVTAEWVQPLFVWIWNGVKIMINILWTFFSYGVAAGLYGRLYRESERELDNAAGASA